MASQTPAGEEATVDYENGWASLTRLMDEGASWSGNERHCAFLNLGDGTYADVSMLETINEEDGIRVSECVCY